MFDTWMRRKQHQIWKLRKILIYRTWSIKPKEVIYFSLYTKTVTVVREPLQKI